MNLGNLFKSNLLDNVTSVSILDMAVALALALCLGLFIFLVYKKTFRGAMYSTSFGVTLVAMSMITTVTILAVTSNVVLSLGMVGALSIVRFRTAVKDPLDIAFLFWSIAVGIILAAGMIPLAVVGSLVIGIVLLVFVNRRPSWNPYIVVVECDDPKSGNAAEAFLKQNTNRCVLKSRSSRSNGVELNLEVRLKDDDSSFIDTLTALPGVSSAVLLSYNGEYMG